ncbi:MAG: molybdopterin-synthase adenylyltransferase MoeB [Xanthomonadales bacterium]|nr:molybdopterin-synthase adenylyltransferase MoeB [Xanthomonadales bacterium]NIN59447.1 molybdopterin-synthase adenylyltransferase MoeB [Xanthomonadales bacterium]NIN74821.1 molybdopterin-synthase adenylyltransferase MoeB [Xanthomonadales bacterium]NIO12648.1 molybdopterin-synthase adenylyltransferase MoeB [Xanthomonadales bacterium]NIP11840.1 molybdopterin-synthase adenylyltransferase MoeB [Xanthomonadales bacterium]
MNPRPTGPDTLELTPAAARQHVAEGWPLLDIRAPAERNLGYFEAALAVDAQALLAAEVPEVSPEVPLLVICASGVRSLSVVRALRERGFDAAYSVAGGYVGWRLAGLPMTYPDRLQAGQVERYARHLVMPEVGPEGQRSLLDAAVLVVGAGGLGCPAALYLAAAGVGRLGIVDHDRVERSNLQRQVLHADATVGSLKTASAEERLVQLNPDIEIAGIPARLAAGNVEQVLTDWDVVIDGSDNFPTRYLLNDACLKLGLPLVYGAVMRFEGQVSVFQPAAKRGEYPCYRCLFPEPPTPEEAPDCNVAGVLGVLPGLVGTLQAAEAIKLLLGIGEPLVGRLLRIDVLGQRFAVSRLPADPQCALCRPGQAFPGYPDYEAFCAA